jgi:plasmid maintenance system antidote protein VapI
MHTMENDDQQAAIRDLVRRMMESTGLDPTGLAKAAGIAPSTLTRFLNQPVKHLLTARTLAKLSKVSGVPVPVGSPLTTALEQEVLAGLRSTDEQGRAMILRLVRSLRLGSDTKPEPPEERVPAPPPKRRASGCDAPVVRLRGR